MKDFSVALRSYKKKPLESTQQFVLPDFVQLAKTYNNMSVNLNGLQRYREATNYAKQAVDTAYSTLGASHSETKIYQEHLNELKRKV